MDKLVLILLGIFLLLWGIAHATNIQIVWMEPVTAIAALCAGVVCLIRALR
jgi:hypothetical protein